MSQIVHYILQQVKCTCPSKYSRTVRFHCSKIYFTLLFTALLYGPSVVAQGLKLNWAQDPSSSNGGVIGKSIKVDANGNTYSCGFYFGNVVFGSGGTAQTLQSIGYHDIFITKYDPSGNCVYAKSIGGDGLDQASAIAVDLSGNVYITGSFEGTVDFDPASGVQNLASLGDYDAFFAKYDPSGNYVYAKSISGAMDAEGTALAIDAANNLYLAGYFFGTHDFDPGTNVQNLSSPGLEDAFLAKYNGNGEFLYAKKIVEGPNSDQISSIALSHDQNIYVTGYFTSNADFNPSSNSSVLTAAGNRDAFVARYDNAGNFVFARSLGGINADQGASIKIGSTGDIFLSGFFQNTADFDLTNGIFTLTSTGLRDIFFARYSPSLSLRYAKSIGGASSEDYVYDLALDDQENVFLAGAFTGQLDFNPGLGRQQLQSAGNRDIFVARYDGNGAYVYAYRFGNVGDDYAYGIDVDDNNTYLTGQFQETVDLDPSEVELILNNNVPNSSKAFFASFSNLPGTQVAIKVFLQGALHNSTTPGIMRDELRASNFLPLEDPYSKSTSSRFAHFGAGDVATTSSAIFANPSNPNNAIVDWVFVEFRSPSDSSQVLETRVALLQRDGDVVSHVDGTSPITVGIDGSRYFVALKHRNHLGVMTAAPVVLQGAQINQVDFSTISDADIFNLKTPADFNGVERFSSNDGLKALWAGDADGNAKVKYQGGGTTDGNAILGQVLSSPANSAKLYNFSGTAGYFNTDTNLDGTVSYQGGIATDTLLILVSILNYAININKLYNYDLLIEQLPSSN